MNDATTQPGDSATIAGVTHHRVRVNGTELHYVSAGASGTPVLLVHGFPETWWAFRKLIPLLAGRHRVLAVDLRGFGDSSRDVGPYDSATMAGDLAEFVLELGLGSVHLTGQDLSGPLTYRLASGRPELVRSLTFIETGLPGFGLEAAMDPTRGGAWHFGFFAAPGIPDMLLPGHERAFLTRYAFEGHTDVKDAVGPADVEEFMRTFTGPDAYRGSAGLYGSMVSEAAELQELGRRRLRMPTMGIGGGASTGTGDFPQRTLEEVADDVRGFVISDSGHFAAQERPETLAERLLDFFGEVDAG